MNGLNKVGKFINILSKNILKVYFYTNCFVNFTNGFVNMLIKAWFIG